MPRPLRFGRYVIPRGAEFGAKRAGGARKHQGTDYHPLDNKDGEPIFGTGPGGVVTSINYNPDTISGLGHSVGVTYPGRRTLDGHMRERTPLALGSPVTAHTQIGVVGHTGNAVNASPPGSHTHHMLWVSGKLIDPESFYSAEPAGGDLERIEEESEATMPNIQYYERVGTPEPEWMRGGRELPGGFEVTVDKTVALRWGRQYSGEGTIPVHLTRDLYIAQQAFLRADHIAWKGEQLALIREAVGAPTSIPSLSDVDVARIAAAVAALPLPSVHLTPSAAHA